MSEENKEDKLKLKLTADLMTTSWEPIEAHHEKGAVYLVDTELELVDVGLAMAGDSTKRVKIWLENGLMYPPTEAEVKALQTSEEELKMLIIDPYVLIQRKPGL